MAVDQLKLDKKGTKTLKTTQFMLDYFFNIDNFLSGELFVRNIDSWLYFNNFSILSFFLKRF